MAHIYGGGDPSIKYIRLPLTEVTGDSYWRGRDCIDVPVEKNLREVPRHIYRYKEQYGVYNLKWLAINGCRYLLVQQTPNIGYNTRAEWHVVDEHKHPKLWEVLYQRNWFDTVVYSSTPSDYIGAPEEGLLLVSRKLNAPVFTYDVGDGFVSVEGEIPILKDVGIDKLIPPEQMYQELSYFVGNIMNESPDMMPPTKMTDKEKIVQHGFDFKQSFRHRNKGKIC